MVFFIQPKGHNMSIKKRFLTTSMIASLATSFVVVATTCGALAHGGGGGGHQGGSDHQQQSDSNRQRQSKTADHSGKTDSSRKVSAKTAEAHHRTTEKLVKNASHPVTDKTPVATMSPAKPVVGVESNHPAEKTNPAETLASSASKAGEPATAKLPVDTIHPIIVSTAPSAATKTNGTASVTPPPDTIHPIVSPPMGEVRDHTHPEGTPAPNEGGVSRGNAAAPVITSTTPAAPNPHPTPITFEQGKLTANTGEPVPVPTGPRESTSAAGDPYASAGKGFDVAISRDHRGAAQQDCGTHPGCDIAGSVGGLGGLGKGEVIFFGKSTEGFVKGLYSSISGLF
jgi:hypothetical protein